jgi:hypothetical protein
MNESEEFVKTLERYRKTQTGTGWHTAPDDGYLYDHLAYHLKEAGLADELATLRECQIRDAVDDWCKALVGSAALHHMVGPIVDQLIDVSRWNWL